MKNHSIQTSVAISGEAYLRTSGPQTATTLKNEITQVIQNYEPRVDVQSVSVSADADENRYRVVIKYLVVNQATTRTAQLFLERLR